MNFDSGTKANLQAHLKREARHKDNTRRKIISDVVNSYTTAEGRIIGDPKQLKRALLVALRAT